MQSCSNKLMVEIGEFFKEISKINLSLTEMDTLSFSHCILSMTDENIKLCGKYVLEC